MAPFSERQVDSIILRLMGANTNPITPSEISEVEIEDLCSQSCKIFMSQPMLLEIDAPIKVCGDIHGQYTDLLRLFKLAKYPPESNFLFLGDYVDRGKQSIETICLLLAFKVKYPKKFYMLRGNHECATMNSKYGFYDECEHRYSGKLWETIVNNCFNVLPVAAIIKEKIFCCHGGLSPTLHTMDQINRLARPVKVPSAGLFCDLLWSDPSKDGSKGWSANRRGVSFTFGTDIVSKFLAKHDFYMIVRGHQAKKRGYEFFAQNRMVTIFSAPNYCGHFGNTAAILCFDNDLNYTFLLLEPL